MSLDNLKRIRFLAPGFITLIFASVLGKLLGLWDLGIPTSWKESIYTPAVIAPAIVYYCTPFRERTNAKFFNQVSENLRKNLVRIAGMPDDPNRYSWKRLRGIFFFLVDNDKSLEKKSQLAYENGAIWTTLADVRALSGMFMFVSIGFFYFEFLSALIAAFGFGAICALSYLGSIAITNRHINIGNQQLEIIEHAYKSKLQQMMASL